MKRIWAVIGAMALGLIFTDTARAQFVVTHDYRLNGSFADALGGPSMVSAGGSLGASGYTFGEGQGPSLSGAIDPATYSISMWFQITDVAGWNKLIDFKDRTSDLGLYDSPADRLTLHNLFTAPDVEFNNNTPMNLVVTRNGVTDTFVAYIDGVQQFSVSDSGGISEFTAASNIIHFLRNDTAQAGEDPNGFLDRVTIFSSVLTQTDVNAVFSIGADGIIAVPEPSTYAMLALAALAGIRLARKRLRA